MKAEEFLIKVKFLKLSVFGMLIFFQSLFGQTIENLPQEQVPVNVEVAAQKDSPLLVTFLNVENSASSYQVINYTLQNVGNKPIRAFTVLNYGSTTSFRLFKPFQPNQVSYDQSYIERANLRRPKTIFLSVDYVEFSDGSSWGEDSMKMSEWVAGHRSGAKAAVEKVRSLIKNNDSEGLSAVLKYEITALPVSESKTGNSHKWQRGFGSGYSSIVSTLEKQSNQSFEALIIKLDELEKYSDKKSEP